MKSTLESIPVEEKDTITDKINENIEWLSSHHDEDISVYKQKQQEFEDFVKPYMDKVKATNPNEKSADMPTDMPTDIPTDMPNIEEID